MPGMMNTILNLGLNDETTEGLVAEDRQPALRLRLLPPLHPDVRRSRPGHRDGALRRGLRRAQDEGQGEARHRPHRRRPEGRSSPTTRSWSRRKPRSRFRRTRASSSSMSRDAVFRSWWNPKAAYYRKMEKIPDDIGTAVQRPGDGVRQHGRHLLHRRRLHPRPRHRREGVLRRIPRERAGRRRCRRHPHPAARSASCRNWNAGCLQPAASKSPPAWKSITRTCRTSSSPFRTARCTCSRPATASAPVRPPFASPSKWWRKGSSTRRRPFSASRRHSSISFCTPCSTSRRLRKLTKLANGIDASPGAAVGRLAFTSEDAVEMSANGPVILIRKETTPDDIHGMDAAKGILTAVGGKSSHAAVVARGMGVPCVVGCGAALDQRAREGCHGEGRRQDDHLKEGDWVSIDGTTGDVYLGQARPRTRIRTRPFSRSS